MKTKTSVKKQLQTIVAILGLAACGSGIANANDLFNQDLDIIGPNTQINPGPVGWTIVAYKNISGSYFDGADSETFCNVQQPGGYGLFFKPFAGSTNIIPSLDDQVSVWFYQDNACTPGTKETLSGYASCEANCSLILPAPPSAPQPVAGFVVEFLDNGGNTVASNWYDLVANGMPTAGPGSMAQLTTSQYTAPAGTVTVRVGATMLNAYSTTGAQSFFVDAFDLESVPAPGSPVITSQPVSVTVAPGGTANMTVAATGATSWVWKQDGVDVVNGVNGVSGQGTATLTITGASTSNVGHYRVLVGNASGSVFSSITPLALNGINIFPTVTLYGNIGDTYVVSRSSTVSGPYTPFSTNKLTVQPQYILDSTLPISPNEFYQEVFSH